LLTVESRSPLEGNDDLLWAGIRCGHFSGEVLGGRARRPERYGTVWKAGGEAFMRCRGTSLPFGHQPASRRSQVALVSPDSQTCDTLPARKPDLYRRDEDLAALETRGGNDPHGCRRAGGCRESSVALEHAHADWHRGCRLAWWFPAGNRGAARTYAAYTAR